MSAIGHEAKVRKGARRANHGSRQRPFQDGVALITVMMVVFFAVTIATAMSEQQTLDIRRTANYLGIAQAKAYALSAEDMSKIALRQDLLQDERSGRPVDHLQENWVGSRTSGLQAERISGSLSDLDGRFNLNWLRDARYPGVAKIFETLLTNLEIPSNADNGVALDLVNALIDWMDEDDIPKGVDGEDLYYLNLDAPYRPANNTLVHISELRLVKGFTDADIQKLESHIAVLPVDSKLNLNTATTEVLQAIGNGLDAQKIVENRGEAGYDSVSAALTGNGLVLKGVSQDMLAVRSEYFALDGSAQVNDRQVTIFSIIYRPSELDEENKFDIVYRDYGKKLQVLNFADENQ